MLAQQAPCNQVDGIEMGVDGQSKDARLMVCDLDIRVIQGLNEGHIWKRSKPGAELLIGQGSSPQGNLKIAGAKIGAVIRYCYRIVSGLRDHKSHGGERERQNGQGSAPGLAKAAAQAQPDGLWDAGATLISGTPLPAPFRADPVAGHGLANGDTRANPERQQGSQFRNDQPGDQADQDNSWSWLVWPQVELRL